jgi:hypothetical protein
MADTEPPEAPKPDQPLKSGATAHLAALKAVFEAEKFVGDFLKLLIGGVITTVTLFGYAYAHHLYRSYGVSLNDLGFGAFDYLFRGFFFIQNLWLFFWFSLIIVLLCAVVAACWTYHSLMAAPILGVALLLLVYLSLSQGFQLANDQIAGISRGEIGRPIQCELTETPVPSESRTALSGMLDTLSSQNRLRLIARDRENVYLAVVLPEERRNAANLFPPQTLIVPRSALLFCRMFGTAHRDGD